jgi:electron transfer flavoprotein beta subunit
MKAKRKPLDIKAVTDLGVDVAPRISTLKVEEPKQRSAGEIVASVDELIEKLKVEGVI